MPTTDPLDTGAIAARCHAATPGPWTMDCSNADCVIWGPQSDWLADVGNWARQTGDNPAMLSPERMAAASQQMAEFADAADAEFIAHCREDVPALLARIAELEQRIVDLEEAIALPQMRTSEKLRMIGQVLGLAPEPGDRG